MKATLKLGIVLSAKTKRRQQQEIKKWLTIMGKSKTLTENILKHIQNNIGIWKVMNHRIPNKTTYYDQARRFAQNLWSTEVY